MATLNDDRRPSQRDIESVLETLDSAYRGADDCEDSETLRNLAHNLRSAITRLTYLASDWERWADAAEEEEEEEEDEEGTCQNCGRPFSETPGEHDDTGWCEDCVG